jgi:transcriptional regulator GlxA family with amidase domain
VQVARPVRFEPNTLILVLTSARRCGISPRQLERLVRRHLNDSPMKYYLKIRLQAARNLLFYTDRPIQEIALASGFSSAQLFSRSFHALFRQSPREFQGQYPVIDSSDSGL